MTLAECKENAELIRRVFQDVSAEELPQFEVILKKIGKRAESFALEKDPPQGYRRAD